MNPNKWELVESGIREVLNKHSIDNIMGIPDYILSRHVTRQLASLALLVAETADHKDMN